VQPVRGHALKDVYRAAAIEEKADSVRDTDSDFSQRRDHHKRVMRAHPAVERLEPVRSAEMAG
jgi:hypothetical protein